jgi:hypothetical protein
MNRILFPAILVLAAAACGPAKPAGETAGTEAAAPVDKAASEKAMIAEDQKKQKAEFDAAGGDAAKIDDLADAGNGYALHSRGLERLKSPEYAFQQAGFEDMEAAAEKNNADALLWVGHSYAYGEYGYPLKPNTGLMTMQKAARQDHVEAIIAVGLYYEQDTLMHDMDKAREWYQKGVELGSEKAKDALAKLGTDQDAVDPATPPAN